MEVALVVVVVMVVTIALGASVISVFAADKISSRRKKND